MKFNLYILECFHFLQIDTDLVGGGGGRGS